MRGLVAVSVALMLNACALGPDYVRPDIVTPSGFRMARAEGESIANLPWWKLLRDDELQKLVRISLQENKDLHQALASIDEFEARLAIARMDFAPQVSATANAPALGRMNATSIPGFPTPSSYYIQGNLSWEIDIWGRVRRANEAARADLLARAENRRAVVLALVSGVAQAYFDLRQLDMQLDIVRRTLQSWEESVRIARARLRQGLIPKLDADQFEAERANAASRAAELKRRMVQKENELNVLLGRNPAQIPRGRALTDQMLPPAVPAGLPSELLQRRPDTASGAAADRGHRPDRGRKGRAISEDHAHGTPRPGEPAAFRSRERCLWIRRPRFGRAPLQCPSLGLPTAGGRGPSQAGPGPIPADDPGSFQGGRGCPRRGGHGPGADRGARKPSRLATIGPTSRRTALPGRTLQLSGCAHIQAEPL